MKLHKKRFFAALLCVCLIAASIFSLSCLVKASGHDCIGDHCPICACMRAAEKTLRFLSLPTVPAAGIMFPLLLWQLLRPWRTVRHARSTPVAQKVRLND